MRTYAEHGTPIRGKAVDCVPLPFRGNRKMTRLLSLARRLWRWLMQPGCPADCPKRGPDGEMCRECLQLWAIK